MKILSKNKIYKGFLSILNLKVETEKGEVITRQVMSRARGKNSDDSTAALVYDTKNREFIFVSQFRAGLYNETDQNLVESVAGTLEVNENPEECIIREIEEEIGYKTDQIEFVGDYYVSPGGTSEKIYLYIALVSEQISEGGGLAEEHEEIDIIRMSEEEVVVYNFMDIKTKLLLAIAGNNPGSHFN